ncbi:MAG: tetratricopeptide repeat protein [Bacteroidales bacterium]|nr:tetratricopeptide repeat protein [Bacteroidales bacterium]
MIRLLYIIIGVLIAVLFVTSCKSTKTVSKGKQDGQISRTLKDKDVRPNTKVFIEASRQKYLGNYEEAIKLYLACLELDPSDDASSFELAKLYNSTNRIDEALSNAEFAADTDKGNKWYQLFYAGLLKKTGNYEQAVDVYDGLVTRNPKNPEYKNQLAIAYIYIGDLDKAIDIYNELEQQIGVTEEISLKKQSIYLQQDKIENAIEEIENLIADYPYVSTYYGILAEMCLSAGLKDKALESYQKIVEVDPENPYVHISLADFYKKNGEPEKALEELKTGFANPALDIETKIQIIITYYSDADNTTNLYEEAFDLARILVETHPTSPEAYSVYGDFLAQTERYEEARDAFREVLRIDSSRYMIWEQLLLTESELNDTEAILNESSRAIELFPEQPLLYLFKGSALYMKKEWLECTKVLNTGLYFVGNNPLLMIQYQTYLGDAYYQLDDFEKSDKSYRKVLEVDPENDYVLNNFAYYLSLRNENLEEAAQMAKKATELKPNNSANQDTYGWVLYKLGYYSEAKNWIEKAIENGANENPVIIEHLGDVYFKLGIPEEAIRLWKEALGKGKGSDLLEKKVKDKTLYE